MPSQLTRAQARVVRELRAIGGSGYVGPGIVDGKVPGHRQNMAAMRKLFGEKEYNRIQRQCRAAGLTDRGVTVTPKMVQQLIDIGLLRTLGVPGAVKLIEVVARILEHGHETQDDTGSC